MKVETVSLTIGRVYNMGNYETFRLEGTMTATVDEGETPQEAVEKLRPILRESLRSSYRDFKPPRRAKESRDD